jgi:hypothetical protein
VPRAPNARRVGLSPALFGALTGLAAASACGVATNAGSSAGTGASSGGSSGTGFGVVDAASACQPSGVQAYVPGDYKHAEAPSPACLVNGVPIYDQFYELCLGADKSKEKCDAFNAMPGYAACAACVLTSYSSSRLGPIIDYGEFVGGNVPGCLEIADPSAVSCASAVQALADCELAACQANCPVSDQASLAAREACSTEADETGCASYYQIASTCLAAEPDAGTVVDCSYTDFLTFYLAVVPLFCAPAQAPAGADASEAETDAAAEAPEAGGDAGPALPDRDASPIDAGVVLVDSGRD